MSDEKRYNGWTNYETWCANIWIDNDGGREWYAERAEELVEEFEGDRDAAESWLADEMESDIDEYFPKVSGMYSDLLRSAVQEINWREIAGHYVADVD